MRSEPTKATYTVLRSQVNTLWRRQQTAMLPLMRPSHAHNRTLLQLLLEVMHSDVSQTNKEGSWISSLTT